MSYELSAIISIGLEKYVINEFNLKKDQYFKGFPIKAKVFKGGVGFYFDDPFCFHLIQVLRSPTKFLLKITEFKCRDLPKLFNKLTKVPWENYIYSKSIKVTSTASKSRLINTKKIEETASKALEKWLSANPRKKLPLTDFTKDQIIHLSLTEDLLTLRINCSGEPNFKRNLRHTQGIAPLRENYAYILLSILTSNLKDLSNKTELVDPMCGSGTFLSEALNFFGPIKDRDFSYQYFYALKGLKPLVENSGHLKKIYFCGVEKNKYLESFHQKNFLNSPEIKFIYNDFFSLKRSNFSLGKQILICNLPYGKRVKVNEDITSFYEKFMKHVFNEFKDCSVGVLLPTIFAKKLKLKQLASFKNGGLNVSFCQVNPGFNTNATGVRD